MKKEEKPKEKQQYSVVIECKVPATLTYKVWAETPEEAITMVKAQSPHNAKYNILKRLNIKATVYKAGTSMIHFVKRFI